MSARLKEIEARADVGMVSRYEKGVCLPTEAQLAALEGVLQADRLELFDAEDLDLLGVLRARGEDQGPTEGSEKKATAPPPSHVGRFRKCYRISREFAENLPDDLLQVCGNSSWQSWHDAAMKRLLAEYEAGRRAGKKGGKSASASSWPRKPPCRCPWVPSWSGWTMRWERSSTTSWT